MSIRNKYIAGSLLAGALIVGTVGAVSTFALTNNTSSVREAISNNDFDAFKIALVDEASKRASSLTQDEFNQIVEKHTNRTKVQEAVATNDYNLFKEVADDRILQRVNSEEEFAKLVKAHGIHQATQTKILEAVKNNDFEAFKSAVTEQRTTINNLGIVRSKKMIQRTPTDEMLQQRFDKLVEYYKVNGNLPERPEIMQFDGINGDRREFGKMKGNGIL